MPIYEYTCEKCDSTFELLLRGDDQPACPHCGGRQLAKLLSVPAAHSQGSGNLPMYDGPPCGMGGCGRPECD
jgi:putative FmdB family regulatory protein